MILDGDANVKYKPNVITTEALHLTIVRVKRQKMRLNEFLYSL